MEADVCLGIILGSILVVLGSFIPPRWTDAMWQRVLHTANVAWERVRSLWLW